MLIHPLIVSAGAQATGQLVCVLSTDADMHIRSVCLRRTRTHLQPILLQITRSDSAAEVLAARHLHV